MSAPSRSVEIEVKFDVDDGMPVPDLSSLPGVARVTAAERRSLDAQYFDTAETSLARAGVALRRRTGGPDAGWHIKGPLVDGARVELQWPLGEGPQDAAPPAVLDAVAEMVDIGDAALTPLARIRNERDCYHLLDAAGGVLAELADDHVATRDERVGTERAWREWELELGPAHTSDRDAFFAAAARATAAAGARPAASSSKLARALAPAD